MNVSQLEYADAFKDALPSDDTLARMEDLFHKRRGVMIVAKNRRSRTRKCRTAIGAASTNSRRRN